ARRRRNAAEVDDALEPGRSGSGGECMRGFALAAAVVAALSHRVDEVERGVAAVERSADGLSIGDVALDPVERRLAATGPRDVAGQAAHAPPSSDERGMKCASGKAGRAREEQAWPVHDGNDRSLRGPESRAHPCWAAFT